MIARRHFFRTIRHGCAVMRAASVLVIGCGESPNDSNSEPVVPRNVLIVLIDATVATHMYPWGYGRDPAPQFRKIAREGMLFLNAHSQGANTTPSVWSFMTGRYPYLPEPLSSYTTHRPFDDDYVMAEAFRDAGFRTGGFAENPWIHSKYGWDKGFDHFKDVPALYDHEGERWSRIPDATERTLEYAREWIEDQGDERWFCYVHLIRPHDPYDAPAEYTSRYTRQPLRGHDHPRAEHRIRDVARTDPAQVTQDDLDYLIDMYDANLRYVDDLVGRFYDSLKDAGVTEDTLVVLMSDHGEAFMEHGVLGHNTTAYEEMVHVPLAIVGPRGSAFSRGAYSGVVDLVDLMPTFAELFGLNPKQELAGQSLVPVLRGSSAPVRDQSISHSAFDHFRVAIRIGDRKLIAHIDPEYREIKSFEVYDLKTDPAEKHDLSAEAELAAPLLDAMKRYLAGIERKDSADDPVLDPDDEARLKAIGYLGSD